MRLFQGTLETSKRLFVGAFSIGMTVPLSKTFKMNHKITNG